jgi:hypothetical protein
MLTRVLALLLALGLGALAYLVTTTRSSLDATVTSSAADRGRAALELAAARWPAHMAAEVDRIAAVDFSKPIGTHLSTMADGDASEADKTAARAAIPTALTELAKTTGADRLLVTDVAGTVIARAEDPATAGDSMAGYPPVRDALAGAITDDVWVVRKKVWHVVGVPVLDVGEIMGAVLWTHELGTADLDAAFAGADVAAALYHQPPDGPPVVTAAMKGAGDAKEVTAMLLQSAADLTAARKDGPKLHAPMELEAGGKTAPAALLPLPGQAGEAYGAGLLVLAPAAAAPAEGALDLEDTTAMGLLGGAALALLLALLLPFVDARSVRRQIDEAHAAAASLAAAAGRGAGLGLGVGSSGGSGPLGAAREPRPASALAAVTPAVAAAAAAGSFSSSSSSSSSSLSSAPELGRSPGGLSAAAKPAGAGSATNPPPPMPEPILASSEPPGSLTNTVVEPPARGAGRSLLGGPTPSPASDHALTPHPPPPPPASSAGRAGPAPRSPLAAATADDAARHGGKPGVHRATILGPAGVSFSPLSEPLPPTARAAAPDPFAAKTMAYDSSAPPQPDPEEMVGDRTVVSSVSEVLARASTDGSSLGGRSPGEELGLRGGGGGAGMSAADEAREEDLHYREVYQQFMAIKQRCGEPMDLTYDRFLDRLHSTKKSLLERYQCRTVRFSPYVKAGKAALKATPVK